MLAILPTLALASFEAIYNYIPNSKVTPHNAIDLDQAAIETALGATTVDYATAGNIYMSGGNSKSYATLTVAIAPTGGYVALSTSAICAGTDTSGNAVSGMGLKSSTSAVTAGNQAIFKCVYPTSAVQATFCTCRVGALPTASQVTTGCLAVASPVTITEGANTITLAGNAYTISNDNGRTIQGFGTSSTNTAKLYTNSNSCPGCPYRDYVKFYNYYGSHSYGDDIISAALSTTAGATQTASFASTPLAQYTKVYDFQTYTDDNTRTQVIKKSTAYMNVWMYTIREFEDAIDDCEVGALANNDGAVHAWDEGVAFYTGSLEGTDGSGSGKLIAALADKRCQNYGTCGTAGNAITGTSKVNHDLLTQFQLGRNELIVLNCAAVRPIVTRIVSLMTIPLIQGTLRYAYKMGTLGPAGANTATAATMLTYAAEGVVFAGSVLPLVASCSSGAASVIWTNMQLGTGNTAGFSRDAVKAAFEANYGCLGVTCADIGALNTGGGIVAADAATWGVPCQDASTSLATDVVYERIAGYLPRSLVTDHNAIDLDQAAMETQLGLRTAAGMTAATAIYTGGGNSKSYTRFTVSGSDTNSNQIPAMSSGTSVLGLSASGVPINGRLKSSIAAGATTIDVYYNTNTVQSNYNGGCQVGSLVTTTTRGCFPATGTIVVGWTSITPTAATNLAARTIQGFATTSTATSKMWTQSTSCPGCPYVTFSAFYNYYGDLNYADMWVSAALAGTSLTYTNGQTADFATFNDFYSRVDAAKKGSAYMNVWMYVIREFEDAIDDCTFSSLDNNYGSAHAWDEGVAFYTGSLEGVDGSGSGKLIYALADKRCVNYGTCIDDSATAHGGAGSESQSGTSQVNGELFALFAQGLNFLHNGQCTLVRPVLTLIIKQMTIPLIQGTLRYAYKMGAFGPAGDNTNIATSNTFLKQAAEGAAFAFAVLPLINSCNATNAAFIHSAMQIGGGLFLTSAVQMEVKAALENNYPCLGITCAEIGALTVAGGLGTATDPFGVVCTDPVTAPATVTVTNTVTNTVNQTVTNTVTTTTEEFPVGGIIGIIAAAVLALAFAICICVMYQKEKAGKPIFTSLEGVKGANSA